MTQAQVGLMGKHPGYGDFLQAGVSEHLVAGVNTWLDACLPPLRDQLGEGWGPFWDNAQDLRFWVGRAVLGQTVFGVFHPSRDRVGRRFPLLMLTAGATMPVPLGDDVNQSSWEALEQHMASMTPGQGAAALLGGDLPDFDAETEAETAAGPTLWAHHPTGDLAALLRSAEAPDADRAQVTRSYWWAPGDGAARAAVWLGCHGLPDAQALGWLLGGTASAAEDTP